MVAQRNCGMRGWIVAPWKAIWVFGLLAICVWVKSVPKVTATRANYVVKCIRHSTTGQPREVTMPFHTLLWGCTPHLESYVQFWEPQFKKDIAPLRVCQEQCGAKWLRVSRPRFKMPKSLVLFSLGKVQGEPQPVDTFLSGEVVGDLLLSSPRRPAVGEEEKEWGSARGNSGWTSGKGSPSERVVPSGRGPLSPWKRLHREFVSAPSLAALKERLHNPRRNPRFSFLWSCEEHEFPLHGAAAFPRWEGSPALPARPLPAGACCGSGAGVAWSRRPRAVSGGGGGAEPGPVHPRPPLTPVLSSPLSLQMQRCWGHPTRSWRPPWASPASVRGDAAGAGWRSGGRSRGACQAQVGLCSSLLCFFSREEGSDFRPRSYVWANEKNCSREEQESIG